MSASLRILVVDDNARVRRTIRDVVADLVAAVEECADGDQVIGRFEAFRPDWVLMDIRMPRMDGIAATAALTEAYPAARVVIVSDYEQDDLRRAARKAGAIGYVAKSDLLELRAFLREGARGKR
jgi:CheY-like chemotaxis protein